MARFVSLLVIPGLLACGHQAVSQKVTPAVPAVVASPEELPELTGESGPLLVRAEPRRVGDFFVHRFSLPKKALPVTLTEEVVAKDGEEIIVDFEMQDGELREKLRVHLSARSERVVAVFRLGDAEPEPATVADYEKLMARTTYAPDENAGISEKLSETCLVGAKEHSCEITKYDVFVKDEAATLVVSRSESLGRDVYGEVVTKKGKVLYRAELIEERRGPEVVGAVALQAMTEIPVRARAEREN